MSRTSKTEQESLWTAIEKLAKEGSEKDYFKDLCTLYDKLSGMKYAISKNTYDYITKELKEGKL